MPLTAVRHIRKMRGGAQSQLMEADDGLWYVVKFRNNPQHRRILVNELLASRLLAYLQVAAPETALVRLSEKFLAENPAIHMTLGAQRIPVEPGWHFGSRYPGDPARTAVYDYLPDALLPKVANLEDFRAILVFDKWVGNADGRQSIFYRAMVRRAESPAASLGFVARMIDHGFAFDGPNWDFPDAPLQGLYPRNLVYASVRSLGDFEPWLEQTMHFPEEVIDQAWKAIPPEWIEDDEDAVAQLLGRLFERRKLLPELIAASRQCSTNPFPNWR